MCSRTAKERASGTLIAVGMQTDLYNSIKYMDYKHCVYYRKRYEMQSPDKNVCFPCLHVSSSFCSLNAVMSK